MAEAEVIHANYRQLNNYDYSNIPQIINYKNTDEFK